MEIAGGDVVGVGETERPAGVGEAERPADGVGVGEAERPAAGERVGVGESDDVGVFESDKTSVVVGETDADAMMLYPTRQIQIIDS